MYDVNGIKLKKGDAVVYTAHETSKLRSRRPVLKFAEVLETTAASALVYGVPVSRAGKRGFRGLVKKPERILKIPRELVPEFDRQVLWGRRNYQAPPMAIAFSKPFRVTTEWAEDDCFKGRKIIEEEMAKSWGEDEDWAAVKFTSGEKDG